MQNVSSGDKPASKSRAHVNKSAGFVFDEIDPPEFAVTLYSGSGCNGPGVPNDGKGCGNPLLSRVYHYWPTTYNGLSVKPARFTPPDHNPHANKKICELCFNTYKEFEKFTGKRNIEPRIDVHTQTGEDVKAVDTKVASVNAPPRCVFQTNHIQPHAFGQVKAASDRADYEEYILLCYPRPPLLKDLHRHHDHVLSVRVTLPTGLRIPCSCRQSSALLSTPRATFNSLFRVGEVAYDAALNVVREFDAIQAN
jgi:hypothetical protein